MKDSDIPSITEFSMLVQKDESSAFHLPQPNADIRIYYKKWYKLLRFCH